MVDIKKIDMELYVRRKSGINSKEFIDYWNQIKNNREILNTAIEVVNNKYDSGMVFKGPVIVDCILADYENVDQRIYKQLIKNIYSIPEIARTKVFNDSTVGISYLVKSLLNDNLELNSKQKKFVYGEAINNNHTFNVDYFDLRYYLFSNNSWSLEEKKDLIKLFYSERELYDLLIQMQFDAISIMDQRLGYSLSLVEDIIFDYPNRKTSLFSNEEDVPAEVKEMLGFCDLMYKINPYKEGEKVFYLDN